MLNGVLQDVRFALRQLERVPASRLSPSSLWRSVSELPPSSSVLCTTACCIRFRTAVPSGSRFSVMTYIVSLKTHDIGLLTSVGLTRFLSSQFRGISATDPLTLLMVVGSVMGAGLSACLFPARRATQVDPMTTLRNE